MNPDIKKYPFDPNKNNQGNLFVNYPIDLSDQLGKRYRVATFEGGYFFTSDLYVYDSSGRLLVDGIDYQCTRLNMEAVKLTGEDVCACLVITNPTVSSYLNASGRYLGGKYSVVSDAISKTIADIQLVAEAPPYWQNIENKPADFKPSGHFMYWREIYGFTPVTLTIAKLMETVHEDNKKEVLHKLYRIVHKAENLLRWSHLLNEKYKDHVNLQNNPHRLNTWRLGIYNVDNYPIISDVEITNLPQINPLRYVTPKRTKNIMDHLVDSMLVHQHQITPNQLNTYSKDEINLKISYLLKVNEPAYKTTLLENKTYTEIMQNIPTNYNWDSFTTGILDPVNYSTGIFTGTGYYCADRRYRTFTTLMSNAGYQTTPSIYKAGDFFTVNEALSWLTANVENHEYAFFTIKKSAELLDHQANLTSFTNSFVVLAKNNGTYWQVNNL